MTFSKDAWARIEPTYQKILAMPFNQELAAGSLSRERFHPLHAARCALSRPFRQSARRYWIASAGTGRHDPVHPQRRILRHCRARTP